MRNPIRRLQKLLIGHSKDFAHRTSIHGCNELTFSKTFLGKLFWALCIFVCVCVTLYQVYETFSQYAKDPYITIAATLKEEDMYYPNISFCYQHWVYWVDFEKVKKLNFTKEGLLLGMSYLVPIYSESAFDINRAWQEFKSNMKVLGFKRLSEFYKAISRRDYTGFMVGGKVVISENTEIHFLKIDSHQLPFCFLVIGKSFVEREKASKCRLGEGCYIAESHVRTPIGISHRPTYTLEYDYYTKKEYFCELHRLYQNDVSFELDANNVTLPTPPITVIFGDGYNTMEMYPDDEQYSIRLRASASEWISRKEFQCNKGRVNFDEQCLDACEYKLRLQNCTKCYLFHESANEFDFLDSLCRKAIIFINKSRSDCWPRNFDVSETMIFRDTANGSKLVRQDDTGSQRHPYGTCAVLDVNGYKECQKRCLNGCTRWHYEIGTIKKSERLKVAKNRKYTNIEIYFPTAQTVLFTREIENGSFEKFVGNIGGILGIWLGASVMSVLQVFYIYCCCECSNCKQSSPDDNFRKITSNNYGPAEIDNKF